LTVASGIAAPLGPRTAWGAVATSFITAGAGVRLLQYFSQGELYVDDARLALNVAARSLGGLTQPLDHGQAAPIPFLWIEKVMTLVGGVNEYALRALPVLAGIAGLVLLWKVGRRAFGEQPAALATCLGAFSTFLIGYGSAVKQYTSDALVTLLVMWLVIDVLRAAYDRAAWWRLAAGGAAALWISHPAVFVLAGAALALPASAAVRAVPTWRRRYAFTTIGWAGMFAVTYFFVYQEGATDTFLRGFWDMTFLSPGAPDFAGRAMRAVRAMLVPPLVWPGGTLLGTPLVLGGLTTLAFVAGLVAMFRTRGLSLVLLCAGPYIAVFGAAMLGKYPPVDRLLLFAAPLLFFIYASALCWAVGAFPPRARGPALATFLVLLTLWRYPPALEQALHPERRRETKTLLKAIEAGPPNAPVYLFTPGVSCVCAVWAFYTADWNAPDTARLRRFADMWAAGVAATDWSLPDSVRLLRFPDKPVDAAALSFPLGRRQELIGVGARIQYARGGIARSPAPDAGWVASESDRVQRAANPFAWLWATELYPENAIAALLHGIRHRGGRLIFASRVPGGTVWEVEF